MHPVNYLHGASVDDNGRQRAFRLRQSNDMFLVLTFDSRRFTEGQCRDSDGDNILLGFDMM
nr:hypothetical protein [Streptomyces tsukubensis NRRL18488]